MGTGTRFLFFLWPLHCLGCSKISNIAEAIQLWCESQRQRTRSFRTEQNREGGRQNTQVWKSPVGQRQGETGRENNRAQKAETHRDRHRGDVKGGEAERQNPQRLNSTPRHSCFLCFPQFRWVQFIHTSELQHWIIIIRVFSNSCLYLTISTSLITTVTCK